MSVIVTANRDTLNAMGALGLGGLGAGVVYSVRDDMVEYAIVTAAPGLVYRVVDMRPSVFLGQFPGAVQVSAIEPWEIGD